MSDSIEIDATDVWPEDADDVDEGMVATWFAREGGGVDEGETICEIQVEKVSVDVPAPVSGTLEEILVGENEEFDRGDALGRIDSD
ncbi:lipoyl domain-containing protein [Natrialbaceae archaeon AArc-T1-2]|uniref:lipoyl domain-containing protein n=1 Tax=Natrialbaceae archaeon AArc-T1-2 TaxID=3053904 RepID=UPI00255B3233|nr:lipoyl domain-containing protein [Natrialbaceae archaeon AArc-T1-2]WIV68135.1 lipoyl domain-containing protein [Natrialbaceae archaeon AArc-T1-2]